MLSKKQETPAQVREHHPSTTKATYMLLLVKRLMILQPYLKIVHKLPKKACSSNSLKLLPSLSFGA
jgi:hypothetical protein